MHLTSLRLQHFRNHLDTFFDFGGGTNVLLGGNGQGKTNVIEAIAYLCLTKSFYAGSDAPVVGIGHDAFVVDGQFASDGDVDHHVRVTYSQLSNEKCCTVNKLLIEPRSSIVGRFPVVISSPEHAPITSAGPMERRKFVDFVVSQSNALYFQNLMKYRHILRQRNKLLFDAKVARREIGKAIEPWDEQLVTHGGSLMARRKQFVEEFRSFIDTAYRELVNEGEEPNIAYQPMSRIDDATSEREIQDILRIDLQEKGSEERRIGSTLVGPHRDEFVLRINGLELRKFASQGQHKTFLNALKIAEFFYLKDRCRETPIMLLDDVFSELDEQRSSRLLKFLETLSQTVITSTNQHLFDRRMQFDGRNKIFQIHGGNVVDQKSFAA
jgi:DNA replication and repair protein RecF